MHNSRDSTRRLSRAMPSGCTSLPESPAARCSVCRAKRIFSHASASSGAARTLQDSCRSLPSLASSAKRPTQNSFVKASLGRAARSARGSCHRAAWRTPAGLPPIKPFAQQKVTFFQEASWKLWRVLCLLALGRIRQTQGPEGQGYGGENR